MFIDYLRSQGMHPPADMVCFGVQSVADYMDSMDGDWDALADTTPIRLPFERMWLEYGAYTSPSGMVADAGIDCFELRRNDMPRQSLIEPGTVIAACNTFSERNGEPERFLVGTVVAGQSAVNLGGFVLGMDERGIMTRGEYHSVLMGDRRVFQSIGLSDEDWRDALRVVKRTTVFSLNLMHVKNIRMIEHTPEAGAQAGRLRRHRPPLVTYKTLDVVVPGNRQTGAASSSQAAIPLHLVRGNFANYDEKPLFGKYTGTFWRPSHVKGTQEAGVVDKDYRLRVDDSFTTGQEK